MKKILALMTIAALFFFAACESDSDEDTGDTAADTGDTSADTGTPSDTGNTAADTGDSGDTEADTGDSADTSTPSDTGDTTPDTGDTDSGTGEELQTGGMWIFSGFANGNIQSKRVLGQGGFFGFSFIDLNEKYWAASAIHESVPAYDWEKPMGRLYIFDKEKEISGIEDADFVLSHPDELINAGFGMSAALCDINGDGFDDIAVSSHLAVIGDAYAAGEFVVFYGSETGWSKENHSVSLLSDGYIQKADSMSQSLACTDYDGDGFADVFAGGQNAGPELTGGGSQGMTAFFKGSAEGLSEHEAWVMLPEVEKNKQYFGSSMLIDDLNGDGKSDLVISGWGLMSGDTAANSGGVYIYYGGSDWQKGASEKLFGPSASQFGSVIKTLGINGKKYLAALATSEGKYGAIHFYEAADLSKTMTVSVPEQLDLGDNHLTDFDTVETAGGKTLLAAGGKNLGEEGTILCAEASNGTFQALEICTWQPESPKNSFGNSVKNINGKIIVGMPEYIHRF